MNSRLLRIAAYAALVLAAPLAMLAAVMDTNEYQAMGDGGLDCDSPDMIIMLGIPALLAYGFGLMVFGYRAIRLRKWYDITVAAFCILVIGDVAINVRNAAQEQTLNQTECEMRL